VKFSAHVGRIQFWSYDAGHPTRIVSVTEAH